MATSSKHIDPEWAWQPYSAAGGLQKHQAAHLFRRAGFGANIEQLDQATGASAAELVGDLVTANLEPSEFRSVADSLARTLLAGGDPMKLSAAWVYRLLFTPAQLLEKTTLFWHGHFATGADKVTGASLMWQQNQLLRRHALGNFEELTQAIAKDPAMLIYLDSASNRKSHPNENFARELMELFCLGEGHYSERDVLELARCFTGWEIRRERFRKNPYQHDDGTKEILGKQGAFDGEQAVKIVVDREQTPRFICGKLFRFFLCDEPLPTAELLETPARVFRENNHEIAPVIRLMLSSNLFYSHHCIAKKIKSPVESFIGALRSLKATTNSERLAKGLRRTGQGLFYPPNVKGWDGGRTWINSSTLLARANLFEEILSNQDTKFDGRSLTEYLSLSGADDAESAIDLIESCVMAVRLPSESRERLLNQFQASRADSEQRFRELLHSITATPEFQLG